MIHLVATLTDDALSDIQQRLGSAQAATPSKYNGNAFVKSHDALTSAPGYNKVEVVLPVDGEKLLRDLGFIGNDSVYDALEQAKQYLRDLRDGTLDDGDWRYINSELLGDEE